MKAKPETANIPIIITSVKADDPEVKQAIGNTPKITKPFTPQRLIDMVKKVLPL